MIKLKKKYPMKFDIDYYNSSPDHITMNDKRYEYTDSDALAFVFNNKEKVTYVASEFGKSYGKLYNELYRQLSRDLEEEEIMSGEPKYLFDGRLWLNLKCIITWENITDRTTWKNIISTLEKRVNQDLSDVYLLNVDGQIVKYSDYVQGDTKLNQQSDEDKTKEQERMRQEKAKHLMNRDEKLADPEMSAYLKDRSDNIGKKLSYSNGKGEMPMAQWRALHTTSEGVIKRVNKRLIAEAADGVIDGRTYLSYNNHGAFPIAYDMDIDEVFIGDYGDTDDKMFNKIFKATDNPNMNILLGRYWSEANVIGFWNDLPDKYILNKILDEITAAYGFRMNRHQLKVVIDDTEQHREGFINSSTYLVSYEDFINGDLTNKYVEPEHYEKEYALHLADTDTKREKLGGYIVNRSKNIGKKLISSDGKKEMSVVQYNALRTFSEAVENNKTIVLNESQIAELEASSDV